MASYSIQCENRIKSLIILRTREHFHNYNTNLPEEQKCLPLSHSLSGVQTSVYWEVTANGESDVGIREIVTPYPGPSSPGFSCFSMQREIDKFSVQREGEPGLF